MLINRKKNFVPRRCLEEGECSDSECDSVSIIRDLQDENKSLLRQVAQLKEFLKLSQLSSPAIAIGLSSGNPSISRNWMPSELQKLLENRENSCSYGYQLQVEPPSYSAKKSSEEISDLKAKQKAESGALQAQKTIEIDSLKSIQDFKRNAIHDTTNDEILKKVRTSRFGSHVFEYYLFANFMF